jgi:hypothetical protein
VTWGSIGWIHAPTPDSRTVYSCVIVAGSPRETTRPAVNPLSQEVTVPVGAVTLTAYGSTVALSKASRLLAFAPMFEQALSAAFAQLSSEKLSSDIIVCVEFEASSPQKS